MMCYYVGKIQRLTGTNLTLMVVGNHTRISIDQAELWGLIPCNDLAWSKVTYVIVLSRNDHSVVKLRYLPNGGPT
ncbi:hypothetical protein J1N35_026286 [Gossypium stocksii]|uniref:Uncharacterized protein n=1 Tax=Gossypium stocksii TaxID=47602 RepID=A0A9D3V9F4_9ROSI|nr:hypothetical protein J1N35_026286 [Gossypium stocksii]